MAVDNLADQAAGAILGANPFVGFDGRELVADVVLSAGKLVARPGKVGAEVARTGLELGRILAGQSKLKPPDGDRRFADQAWTENPFHRRLLQGYLALTAAAHRLVDDAGLKPADRQRAQFAVTLLADALSPTNALVSNPAAVKRAFETAGLSLIRGARNLVRDLRENGGVPSPVNSRPFKVGGNLAPSPGAVVHRDEVFELIQYKPATETVFERPLL